MINSRKTIYIIALCITFVPGMVIILNDLISGLEGINPFIFILIVMVGGPFVLLGLATYFFLEFNLKRKVLFTLSILAFQMAIMPIVWGINNIKLQFFMFENRSELEYIANQLLDHKWTLEQANAYADKAKLTITIIGSIDESSTVWFLISGMLDNCHGIAFTRTGRKALENDCGTIISWEKISDNWFEWGTT